MSTDASAQRPHYRSLAVQVMVKAVLLGLVTFVIPGVVPSSRGRLAHIPTIRA